MSLYGHLVVCTPKQVVMDHKEGLPVQHLGRYATIFAAQHHMRFLGGYIKDLAVWDIRASAVVAKLEQQQIEYDPIAPPIDVYERVQTGSLISWKHVTYDYHKAHNDEVASGPE